MKKVQKAKPAKADWVDPPVLLQFKEQLLARRYSAEIIPSYVSAARQFLKYLRKRRVLIQDARPLHLTAFLDEKLRQSKRRLGRAPKWLRQWPREYTSPVHQLLRMVHSAWPPREPPANEGERVREELCERYGSWLTNIHGLAQATLRKNGAEARRFLDWLQEHRGPNGARDLGVADLDAYLAWRMPALRRASRHGVSSSLRSFLRYLYSEQLIGRDLSLTVSGPILYKFDEIPRAFTEEQVELLLTNSGRDREAGGLRAHAVLLLLAKYGLRAGEVCGLRLEDIDWKGDRLRIRQSKSGRESFLPLLPQVGDAIVRYLRKARPSVDQREVFLCLRAPFRPLTACSLDAILYSRLQKAGIEVKGRHGSHAFRFARAGSLLRAKVSLKSIGDLLGHRSVKTTGIYLRVATDELRSISLDLPREERR